MGQGPPLSRRRLTAAAALGAPAVLGLLACGPPHTAQPPTPESTHGTTRGDARAAAQPSQAGTGDTRSGFAGESHLRGHRLRDGSPPAASPPPAVRVRRTGVLIAGGGVAGLAAARALRLRGVEDFAVLEMDDEPGGNSRATRLGGMPCPLGAHYLPLPGDDTHEVQDFLEECGLRRRVAGRWVYDERHLCHSPQERVYFQGRWQEGLLPMDGVSQATLEQYRRFASAVQAQQRAARHTLPAARAPLGAAQATLDAQTFTHWLDRQGLDDPVLRGYLDYCCRDDYGAGASVVSAWAGVHYFASRHGFAAPGSSGGERDAVLTWPEGNAWLVRQLAQPMGERVHCARTVRRIAVGRHGVEIDAWVDDPAGTPTQAGQAGWERWQARHVIVALPLHVAARVLDPLPPMVQQAAAAVRHAAWVVTNLRLRGPLHDPGHAPPAWDNVIHGSAALGYVDARHQRLDPTPGPTVLTHYHALGIDPATRRALMDPPWTAWRDRILAEWSVPHPDLPRLLAQTCVTRHGHAMACPVPGTLARLRQPGWPALGVSQRGAARPAGRVSYAHSDWAGYSVFEEAFTLGHHAGMAA